RDLAPIADQRSQFTPEGLADATHATDRLHQGGLHVVQRTDRQVAPEAGAQQVVGPDWLRQFGAAADAAAGIPGEAAAVAAAVVDAVAVVVVQRAPPLQRCQQDLLVLLADQLVEAAALRRLAQQFGNVAVVVGLDRTET